MRFLTILAAPCLAVAVLVSFPSPPRGYNTFDTYGYQNLNASGVSALISDFASSPLFSAGYDQLYGFSGWANTLLPNGTWAWHLDGYGLPIPAPERFAPGQMAAAAAAAKAQGVRFGLWHIRGIHASAAAARLPVKGMEQYTLDMLVDQQSTGGGKNGSCLWASDWLGVNASHPAAQAYYDAVVAQLLGFGVSVIEADCFMCEPCYKEEMLLFSRAVAGRPEGIVLYYSPGGGNTPADAQWVKGNNASSYYRTLTDFHGGWYGWGGLQEAFFIAGNFTAALPPLQAPYAPWPDLDMVPMDAAWWGASQEQADRGQTIATLWFMGRYPIFSAGALPLDAKTLSYLTNPLALELNQRPGPPALPPTRVLYEGNCTCLGGLASCIIPHGPADHPPHPCVAKWVAPLQAWTALALTNLGEDGTSTTTSFAQLGLPALPTAWYRVLDVWTGAALGTFPGDQSFTLALRMHASALLQVLPAA